MTTQEKLTTLAGASALIYEQHGADDPEYQFWCGIARLFDRAASALDEGLGEMRNWDRVTWNVTLSAAQNYLALNGA